VNFCLMFVLYKSCYVVQLIRRVLRQCFILLHRRGWLSSDICHLADVLHVTVLDGLNDHIPDGIRFHMVDIFIDELDRSAGDGQVSSLLLNVLETCILFLKKIRIMQKCMACTF